MTIYLSNDELEQLEAKCKARGVTRSELVRRWILAQPRTRDPQKNAPTPPADPRQTTIDQQLTPPPSGRP